MDQDTLVDVLLLCLRPEDPEARAARLKQFTSAEWEALFQLAQRHGVAPLLYRRLKPLAAAAAMPAPLLQMWRQDYLANGARNTQRYLDLAAVLRRFGDQDLPAIVLKGAHLAEIVYGNIALRPMCDVDLLIRKADMPRADSILLEMGYRPDPHHGPTIEATHFHHVYLHPKSGRMLEVHWHVLPPEQASLVDLDRWWRGAAPVTIAGQAALVLSPADLLAHLCLHPYLHRYECNLRAFCDIAEVAQHYRDGLDWERFETDLRTATARKAAYLALRLARKWLGAPVPGNLLSTLYTGDAAEWEASLRELILKPDPAALSLNTPGLVQLWGRRPLAQKAVVLLQGLFPSAETLARMYAIDPGSPRRYLVYPRYLSQVFRQFGLTAWRLARGDRNLTALASRVEALDRWLQSP